MPYTTVVAGTSITASWGNANVRDQVVTPFADTTARSSAVASPVDGMISVLTTTDRVDVYNGTSWSAIVAPSNGVLTSWTPVIVQGATPTLTNTGSTYIRAGRNIFFEAVVTLTSAGTVSNVVTMSLPVTAKTYDVASTLGSGFFVDASVPSTFNAIPVWATASTIKFLGPLASVSLANGLLGLATSNFNVALAAGDIVSVRGSYEASADG